MSHAVRLRQLYTELVAFAIPDPNVPMSSPVYESVFAMLDAFEEELDNSDVDSFLTPEELLAAETKLDEMYYVLLSHSIIAEP